LLLTLEKRYYKNNYLGRKMIKRVLLVDDEKPILEILTDAFKIVGYEVTTTGSAEEALELMKDQNYPINFFDINLPGMTGVELCIKCRDERPTDFYFAMTGFVSLFDLVKCRKAGFDDYFPKPFNITELIQVAEDAFAKLERWREG